MKADLIAINKRLDSIEEEVLALIRCHKKDNNDITYTILGKRPAYKHYEEQVATVKAGLINLRNLAKLIIDGEKIITTSIQLKEVGMHEIDNCSNKIISNKTIKGDK